MLSRHPPESNSTQQPLDIAVSESVGVTDSVKVTTGQRVTFLFWNIHRRRTPDLVAALAHEHDVHVLMLAESRIPEAGLLTALNRGRESQYYPDTSPTPSPRLRVYFRYLPRYLQALRDSKWVAIRRFQPPAVKEMLLVIVHLPSKLWGQETDQPVFCEQLAEMIKGVESEVGHSRTVVVGDLNMNPFESGVISATGLHAVMDRRVAEKGSRRVRNIGTDEPEKHEFFYNPMWNHFGDLPPSPPGTYFYHRSRMHELYWHMFDQVLIRPELLDSFRTEDVTILTRVGGASLLSGLGRPDAGVGSDHLPILFKLYL